jgi:hypothetical protein
MPNESPQPTPPAASPQPAPDSGHVPMSEEFDRAKWTLPPVVPVLIGVAIVVVVIAVWAVVGRSKPAALAEITSVFAGEVPNTPAPPLTPTTDQNATAAPPSTVMVAIQIHFRNATEKPIWIRELGAKLTVNGKEYEDTAAAPDDYDRYAQAVPGLKEHLTTALLPEMKIPIGGEASGSVLVSFPVDKATFEKRSQLAVVLHLYDQEAVVIAEKK